MMSEKKAARLTEVPVSLRIHPELIADADALAQRLEANPYLVNDHGGSSRSTILRLAIGRGLRMLQREFDEKESNGPTKE